MTNSVPGIYVIRRIGSGDSYVGQSVNIRKRWVTHRQDFKKNRHASKHMQRIFNKHGADIFEYSILEKCSVDELTARESFWMEKLQPKYNVCQAAGSCLGLKYGESTRQKHRTAMMGNKIGRGRRIGLRHHPETIAKISAARKGRPTSIGIVRTEEFKKKVSLAKAGVPWSEKRRAAHLRGQEIAA